MPLAAKTKTRSFLFYGANPGCSYSGGRRVGSATSLAARMSRRPPFNSGVSLERTRRFPPVRKPDEGSIMHSTYTSAWRHMVRGTSRRARRIARQAVLAREVRWYHGKIDGVRRVYMARTRQSLIRYLEIKFLRKKQKIAQLGQALSAWFLRDLIWPPGSKSSLMFALTVSYKKR